MLVAGVDPSLTRTAVVVGHPGVYRFGVCGSSAEGMPLDLRFNRYHKLVEETLREIGPAQLIVIEGYSYASQGRAVITLGEYGGLLRVALLERAVEVIEVPPTTLKKFVTGSGNASKAEYITEVVKRWGFSFKGEDEYFAAGLFRFGLVWSGQVEAENSKQKEAVASLLKPASNGKKKRK